MARVKGGLFAGMLDVSKRFPLDSRMLVAKREDLINPTTWTTNTLTTESTYNTMIVSVNSDGEHNGVYYLIDRKLITADNYSAYQTALGAGKDVNPYFSMWMKLGTLNDVAAVEKNLKDLIGKIKPCVDLTPVDGTIVFGDAENGGKSIGVAISAANGNALVAVDDGLFVPAYTTGNGIEIVDNQISVRLAADTHGLVAVDGALTLSLVTKDSDGAMSKEDKRILDAIPELYVARKYEISHKPDGTLVDYREKEIRVMCPTDTEWTLQNSGEGADANMYYIGFKAYAPDGATGFKEDLKETIEDDTMYDFEGEFAGVDSNGRKYSIVWLPAANFDGSAWTYYGSMSSESKYIGWYYTVEWYNADGKVMAGDRIRINLSNESCHNNNEPYYMAKYATSAEVAEAYSWGEL